MIVIYESNALSERYPFGPAGACTTSEDKEEWLGIRSQLIAQMHGWA